jgi:GABA(A) receptor-associated protein
MCASTSPPLSFKFARCRSTDERISLCTKLKKQWSDRIPIVLEKNPTSQLPEPHTPIFLARKDDPYNSVMLRIRRNLQLEKNLALLFMINGSEMQASDKRMIELYEGYKAEDGFLYIQFKEMDVLG